LQEIIEEILQSLQNRVDKNFWEITPRINKHQKLFIIYKNSYSINNIDFKLIHNSNSGNSHGILKTEFLNMDLNKRIMTKNVHFTADFDWKSRS
jgi:hypothetical protein